MSNSEKELVDNTANMVHSSIVVLSDSLNNPICSACLVGCSSFD